jgi:hypothetical protein
MKHSELNSSENIVGMSQSTQLIQRLKVTNQKSGTSHQEILQPTFYDCYCDVTHPCIAHIDSSPHNNKYISSLTRYATGLKSGMQIPAPTRTVNMLLYSGSQTHAAFGYEPVSNITVQAAGGKISPFVCLC